MLQLHKSWTKWALKASNLQSPASHRNNSAYLLLQLDPISLKKKHPGNSSACHAPVGTCAPTSTWGEMPTTSNSHWSHFESNFNKQSKPSETTLFVIIPFPFWPRVVINLKNNVLLGHVVATANGAWHLIGPTPLIFWCLRSHFRHCETSCQNWRNLTLLSHHARQLLQIFVLKLNLPVKDSWLRFSRWIKI